MQRLRGDICERSKIEGHSNEEERLIELTKAILNENFH